MDDFNLQLTLIKFCGIMQSPSTRLRILSRILVTWLYIASFYYMISAIFYAATSDDVLEIAESLSPVFSGTYSAVKLAIYLSYQDQLFDIVDEIRELNKKCEPKISLFCLFLQKTFFIYFENHKIYFSII